MVYNLNHIEKSWVYFFVFFVVVLADTFILKYSQTFKQENQTLNMGIMSQ